MVSGDYQELLMEKIDKKHEKRLSSLNIQPGDQIKDYDLQEINQLKTTNYRFFEKIKIKIDRQFYISYRYLSQFYQGKIRNQGNMQHQNKKINQLMWYLSSIRLTNQQSIQQQESNQIDLQFSRRIFFNQSKQLRIAIQISPRNYRLKSQMSFNDFMKLHYEVTKQLSEEKYLVTSFFPPFLQVQLKNSMNSLSMQMQRKTFGFTPYQDLKELKTDQASYEKNGQDVSAQMDEEKSQNELKNDTKNIPKNFGKAIIAFIRKNQHIVKRLLSNYNINYKEYLYALKRRKNKLNNIASLRSLWLEEEFRFAKVTRILSEYWMKKGSLEYIFSSRISNYRDHVKYRKRMLEALYNPAQFTHIKTNSFS